MGIEFVKGKVARLTEADDQGVVVRVERVDQFGQVEERKHDLVVLSLGLLPAVDVGRLAALETGSDGFAEVPRPKDAPCRTSQEGFFVAGTVSGPMDIVDTIVEAGAAATTAVVEMATSRAVVLALGAGSTVEHAEAFGRALRRVARRKSAKGGGGESGASAAAAAASLPFSPPPGLSSSSSSSSSRNTELIPLRASPGRRRAAAHHAPNPPGIPLVLEGEPLTPAAVAAAAEAWAAGSAVVGLSSSSEEQGERGASCRGEPFVRVFGLE